MRPLQEKKDFNNSIDYATSIRGLGNSGKAKEEGGEKEKRKVGKEPPARFPFYFDMGHSCFLSCRGWEWVWHRQLLSYLLVGPVEGQDVLLP